MDKHAKYSNAARWTSNGPVRASPSRPAPAAGSFSPATLIIWASLGAIVAAAALYLLG